MKFTARETEIIIAALSREAVYYSDNAYRAELKMSGGDYDKQSRLKAAECEAIIAQLKRQPRCASCGDTDNLTMGYAGGNEIYYCPEHKADEELS